MEIPKAYPVVRQLLNMGCPDFAAKRLTIGIAQVVYYNEQEIRLPLRINVGIEIFEATKIKRRTYGV
jgi:hypothetical protein